MIALLTVQACRPAVLFRQVERRIGLGQDTIGGIEKPIEVGLGDGLGYGKQRIDLRRNAVITPGRPYGAVIKEKQASDIVLDSVVFPVSKTGDDFAVSLQFGVP